MVSAAMWFGRHQVISHFCSFRSTAYIKIPAKLRTFKLEPKVTKLTLVEYFGYRSYKLLNCATRSVYNIRNGIFKKGTMNFTISAIYVEWNDDNDPILVYVMTKRLAEVQVTGQCNNKDGRQTS